MLKKIAFFAGSVLFAANLMAAEPAKAQHVLITTTNGDIEIELDPVKAPISTKNFLAYVDKGFYTNTIFHRVIPGFMVQGGGFTAQMSQKPTDAPIKNEASNGLHNVRGTLSMARTNDPNSATSQFFINVADNAFLDPGRDAGYAVFAKVVKGMDVVDIIVNSQTTTKQGMQNVPIDPVVIKSAKRID
ncbi:peptidylprolyl isomerase A [Pseudomonas tolaasii]|uniref:Peptidyl-prolyl cis-trans isomerase n=2 Tax=Pseudomonas tolaasii TaxID=29442 RepID=A0A7Y8DQ32_PSETO|nr:peptidylprolyl isomerase A [Pseudomonas tolaasii]ARB27908.1 peptidylprolyl isomerase A [Pseudomonas tolaasii]KAB0477826.1 peptidylprolyl isomerase A [Pseudomonas tolaasii]MBW1248146.1 peptidylprolyl isomerase A [Pseudomonas tolaasii]MBW4795783.1 peptidylprolyl isomerase A [Pseudomonas tolaasii]MBY8940284.1 peptidylprolyl isomerase A [Pseudomonas tolaasii]